VNGRELFAEVVEALPEGGNFFPKSAVLSSKDLYLSHEVVSFPSELVKPFLKEGNTPFEGFGVGLLGVAPVRDYANENSGP